MNVQSSHCLSTLRFFLIALLGILYSCSSFGQEILISEEGTITTCSGTVYDSGGFGLGYQNNEEYTLTLCADEEDACLQLDFPFFDIEQGYDVLTIYQGESASGTPIAELTGDIDPETINLGVPCMTLVFTSDGSVTDPGFEIEVSCVCPTCDDGVINGQEIGVDCGGPDCPECSFLVIGQEPALVTTCEAVLFDNGFTSDYENNSDDVLTVCGETAEDCLKATFLFFDVQSTANDWLFVYAGDDTSAPLIGGYNQGNLPPEVISGGSQCLTFEFVSDNVNTSGGFGNRY